MKSVELTLHISFLPLPVPRLYLVCALPASRHQLHPAASQRCTLFAPAPQHSRLGHHPQTAPTGSLAFGPEATQAPGEIWARARLAGTRHDRLMAISQAATTLSQQTKCQCYASLQTETRETTSRKIQVAWVLLELALAFPSQLGGSQVENPGFIL